jgi:hypothetical protein
MANTFIELNDTPSTFDLADRGRFVKVSSVADTLVFALADLNSLVDVTTTNPQENSILQYSGGTWRDRTCSEILTGGDGLTINGQTISLELLANGGLSANANGLFISNIANVEGTYGNTSFIPSFTVNSKGQIVDITQVAVDVSEIEVFNPDNIIGDPGSIIVTRANGNATLSLTATGITAGVYGDGTQAPIISVDTYGRIQDITLVDIVGGGNGNVVANANVTTRAFSEIFVTGMSPNQSPVIADTFDDDLTLNAGTGINIITTPANDVITFSINTAELAATLDLGDLNDVDLTGLQSTQGIAWNGSNWVPTFIANSIFDLADLDLTGLTSGDSLLWDGNDFIPYTAVQGLTDLSDVNITGRSNGDYLIWDAANAVFVPSAPISSIDELNDVDLTGITSGQALTWNGSSFTPQSLVLELADLDDVSANSPSSGEALVWNGSTWLPGVQSFSINNLSDVNTSGRVDGDLLVYNFNAGEFQVTKLSIGDLTDIDLTGLQNGWVLAWNSSTLQFEPIEVAGGDLGNINLTALSVTTNPPSGNGSLTYNNAGVFTFTPTLPQVLSLNDSTAELSISRGNTVDFSQLFENEITLLNSGVYGSSTQSSIVTVDSNGRIIDIAETNINFTIPNTGVVADTYGNATLVPQITVGADGRLTLVDEIPINVPLAPTGVSPGTYGDSGNIAQFTVGADGRITSVTETPVVVELSTGAYVERFKVNYAPNGDIASVSDLTSGIDGVAINSTVDGIVTVTFDDTKYNFAPAMIMFWGYKYDSNKYEALPVSTDTGIREIAGGGSPGSPTVFNGSSTISLRLQVRETETGASRGGFGTTTHAWIQFII